MTAPKRIVILRLAAFAAVLVAGAGAAIVGLHATPAAAQNHFPAPNVNIDALNGVLRTLPQVIPQIVPQPGPPIVVQVPAFVCPPGQAMNNAGRCVVRGGPVIAQPPQTRVPDCRGNLVWSPQQERCVERPPVIVIDPAIPDCRGNLVWSPQFGRCVERPPVIVIDPGIPACPGVLVWSTTQNRCVERPTRVDTPPVTPRPAGPQIDVARVQSCLTRLGFNPGPIDGAIGRNTRTAFRSFQNSNGLSARPNNITDQQSLGVLFDLCDTQIATPLPPVAPPLLTPIPVASRCLSPDLYDMLVAEYGPRSDIQSCVAACLPKPAFMSEGQLAEIVAREGVSWCEACIQLGAYLPLRAVLEIEQAANVTLCASPPLACFLPGRPLVEVQREVRTIFRDLPYSVGNEGDIAVVIGNEAYLNGLPANQNGLSDAEAVRALLVDKLGYRAENIIDLRNATLADLHRIFGDSDRLPDGRTRAEAGLPPGAPGELRDRLADRAEDSDVFIYASSHGMASTGTNLPYLMPVDGRTDDLAASALPLSELYESLGRLGTRTTMLVLEANFGQTLSDFISPPNLPAIEVSLDPATPVPGLAVFKASDRDQRTLEDPEYGIGLFTRYLIEGLAGAADAAPLGNADQRIDTVELFIFTADMVRTAARKSFGLEQKPLLARVDNLVVGRLAALQQ